MICKQKGSTEKVEKRQSGFVLLLLAMQVPQYHLVSGCSRGEEGPPHWSWGLRTPQHAVMVLRRAPIRMNQR